MTNTNKARAEQLGMPYGTAANRLRKMLMFKFAQELGKDRCFKCGEKIETERELSIEHKKAWFNIDPDLFWDLDNIAFSHLSCNRPDNPYRKHPVGHHRCYVCKEVKPFSEFYKNNYSRTGHQTHCKECHKSWRKRGAVV